MTPRATVSSHVVQGDDRREWLEADGLGGFASGTASTIRTRRYHALLLAATTPPAGRMALVNGLEAWVTVNGTRVALTTSRYAGGVEYPDGNSRLAEVPSTIRGRNGRSHCPTARPSSTKSSCLEVVLQSP